MFIHHFILSFHFTKCRFISQGYSFCEMMKPELDAAVGRYVILKQLLPLARCVAVIVLLG